MFRPASLSPAVLGGRPVGALRCERDRRPTHWVHVELFARGRVVLLPAGIGLAPPRRRDGAYVRGRGCRYPVWTEEPTGLVAVAGPGRTLADLAAVWGRPLTRGRIAAAAGPVRAFVGGRRWHGAVGAIPLSPHAQIVLEAGTPVVAPHARYAFPPGR